MEHDDHDPLAPDLTGGAPLPAFEQFPSAGVDMRLRIGQRVRHTDYKGQRVTGVVYGLSIEHDRGLMVDCRLDAPIVIPADEHGAEIKIWSQLAQAHEFTPFDERDELVHVLVGTLVSMIDLIEEPAGFEGKYGKALDEAITAQQAKIKARLITARAAIAKATGSVA
jgi:hypothetical protein